MSNLQKIAHSLRGYSASALKTKTWLKGDSFRRPTGPSKLFLAASESGCTQKALLAEIERQNAIALSRSISRHRNDPLMHTPFTPFYQVYERDGVTIPHGKFASHLKSKAILACSNEERGDSFISIEDAGIADYDRHQRLWLITAAGWCKYSRRAGTWHRSMTWLAGHDPDQPSGYFCRRVPSSCSTVSDALEWLQPAEVKKALSDGRKVIRQGDVYLVEMQRRDNLSALPRNHTWNRDTRTIEHPEHGPVHVPFPVKAVPQKNLLRGVGD